MPGKGGIHYNGALFRSMKESTGFIEMKSDKAKKNSGCLQEKTVLRDFNAQCGVAGCKCRFIFSFVMFFTSERTKSCL